LARVRRGVGKCPNPFQRFLGRMKKSREIDPDEQQNPVMYSGWEQIEVSVTEKREIGRDDLNKKNLGGKRSNLIPIVISLAGDKEKIQRTGKQWCRWRRRVKITK